MWLFDVNFYMEFLLKEKKKTFKQNICPVRGSQISQNGRIVINFSYKILFYSHLDKIFLLINVSLKLFEMFQLFEPLKGKCHQLMSLMKLDIFRMFYKLSLEKKRKGIGRWYKINIRKRQFDQFLASLHVFFFFFWVCCQTLFTVFKIGDKQ